MFFLPPNHFLHTSAPNNLVKQRLVLVSCVVGFFLGYLSWIVGSIFAMEALRSLIRILRHRSAWLTKVSSSSSKRYWKTTRATVLAKDKKIDNLTESESYRVTIQYKASEPDNDYQNHNNTIEKMFEGAAGRDLYDQVLEGESIKVKVGTKHPRAMIPTILFHRKRRESLYWARYFDLGIAIAGSHLYLFGALTYCRMASVSFALSSDNPESSSSVFGVLVALSILSPILMTPYLILEQRDRHQRRMQLWSEDPALLVTELEAIRSLWYRLGPTWKRKVYAVMLVLGVVEIVFFMDLGILPGCLAVWTCAQLCSVVPTRREFLETSYRHQAHTVTGQIVGRHTRQKQSQYFVRIRYPVPSNASKAVEKEIQVPKDLYDGYAPGDNLEVLVLPDRVYSGYPRDKLTRELSTGISTFERQVMCVVTMAAYFVWAWLRLIDSDFWEVEDVVLFFIIVCAGPSMMMPQADALHRLQYKTWWKELVESGDLIFADETTV